MAEAKPFQHEGALFLSQRTRALLADEPGVGKTGQLIMAANLVEARTLGVVCPSIGMEHWRREANKWNFKGDRLDVIAWDDAHDARDTLGKLNGHMAQRPMQWDALVPDEAHFGKNPHARRTKAVFAKGGLGWYARRIWAASGTPSPNNASELWPILRAFGKTQMDQDSFTRYFCVVDDLTGKVLRNKQETIGELRAILKSFSLRRLKKDVLPELGAIDVQDWYVKIRPDFLGEHIDLAGHEEGLHRAIRGKSDEEILTFLAGDTDFSTLRRYNALLKAPAVFETVKFELENGLLDKVVIYGYHREAMQALHAAFLRAKIPAFIIYGDTPKDQRDVLIELWKRTPGAPLIASIIIASTVLDFTCAHQGIMLELGWVPGDNFQAMQRMHRHGQDMPVTVRVATGTPIDEIVVGVLLRKIRMLAEIYD